MSKSQAVHSGNAGDHSSAAGMPPARPQSLRGLLRTVPGKALLVYLALYCVFGVLTVRFFPSYGAPYGDEATYYSYAQHPWTLIGDLFEGYRPKEVMNPYNARLFLTPFSLVFALFGFTVEGARLVVFAYGVILLVLAFLISCRLTTPVLSLAAVIVLSLSPPFVALTHIVRPEGLMAMFIMACVWLVLRNPESASEKTYLWVGLLSSSMLMVHYNGVVFAPLFFIALAFYDGRAFSLRKLGCFALGGGIFLVCFLVLNYLPAWHTLQEYGVLPVTFVSSNRIRILQGYSLHRLFVAPVANYLGYFSGKSFLEQSSYFFTAFLAAVAAVGLLFRPGRAELFFGTLVAAIGLALVLVIPNIQWVYLFYLQPFVFPLALLGLWKISRELKHTWPVWCVLVVVTVAYAYEDAKTLHRAWNHHRGNLTLHQDLRELMLRFGEPETVSVMGMQEFHRSVHEARYRTFHSIASTRDVEATLRRFEPDVVLLHPRSILMIAHFLASERDPGGRGGTPAPAKRTEFRNAQGGLDTNAVHRHVVLTLASEGYVRWDRGRYTWFSVPDPFRRATSEGEPVEIWVRASSLTGPASPFIPTPGATPFSRDQRQTARTLPCPPIAASAPGDRSPRV